MLDFFDEKKLRDACKKQIKELEIREENIKKIISTCEYISWLESFTENSRWLRGINGREWKMASERCAEQKMRGYI